MLKRERCTPTFEEAHALVCFAKNFGSGWKKELDDLWNFWHHKTLLEYPHGEHLVSLAEGPGRPYLRLALSSGRIMKYRDFYLWYKPKGKAKLDRFRAQVGVFDPLADIVRIQFESTSLFDLRDQIDAWYRMRH